MEEKIPTVEYRETSVASRDKLQKKKNCYIDAMHRYIREVGGATCDEIEVALDMRHQTASCFITVMGKKGMIENSLEKRKTRSGRDAIVWVIAQAKKADGDLFGHAKIDRFMP